MPVSATSCESEDVGRIGDVGIDVVSKLQLGLAWLESDLSMQMQMETCCAKLTKMTDALLFQLHDHGLGLPFGERQF